MALTQQKLRDEILNVVAFANDATDRAVADKALMRVRFSVPTHTLWATANDTSTLIIGRTDRAFLIDLITITASATIAVEETNVTTLTFSQSDAAGGSLTTVGTWAINAAGGGALTARTPKVVTLGSAANLSVAAGQLLTVAKSIAAAGTAIVQGTRLDIEGYWL